MNHNQTAFIGSHADLASAIAAELAPILSHLAKVDPPMTLQEASKFLGCSARHLEGLEVDPEQVRIVQERLLAADRN